MMCRQKVDPACMQTAQAICTLVYCAQASEWSRPSDAMRTLLSYALKSETTVSVWNCSKCKFADADASM